MEIQIERRKRIKKRWSTIVYESLDIVSKMALRFAMIILIIYIITRIGG